jgi:hypothetical protein
MHEKKKNILQFFRKALSHFFENFPSCALCMWVYASERVKTQLIVEKIRRSREGEIIKNASAFFRGEKFYFWLFSYHRKIFTSSLLFPSSPTVYVVNLWLCAFCNPPRGGKVHKAGDWKISELFSLFSGASHIYARVLATHDALRWWEKHRVGLQRVDERIGDDEKHEIYEMCAWSCT